MGVFAGIRFLCRAGPMCPAEKCVPGGGAHGPRPTGRYVEPRVGDGVLQWSAAEQMPLGYDVPSARQRRAVIPSQCSHWRGNPSPRRGDAHIRPPLFDKKPPAVYTRLKDAAYIVRRLVTSSKGGGTVCFSCLRFIFWVIRSRYESND